MSTAFHISTLIFALVVVLVPTWIIWKWARNVPPALTHPKHASGFGSFLILFLAGEVGMTLTAVWQAAYMTSEILHAGIPNAASAQLAAMALLPVWATALLHGLVIWQTAARRTASAVFWSVVMLWLAGPGVTGLQSWYFNTELTPASLVQVFGWTLLWTGYLALSRRVALTYATPFGKKLAAGQAQ